MENNKKCYFLKKISFEKGILDNIVDCTIVLLLETNKERKKSIFKTLNKFKLCKNTIVQFNKGYKNCEKKLYEQSSLHDLNDSYYNAFKYANKNKFRNLLVLEDDVIFDHNIKNLKVIKNIENLYKNVDVDIFSLGTSVKLIHPSNILLDTYNCKKLIFFTSTHACIYNKNFRDSFIKKYENNRYIGFDEDINIMNYRNIYNYNKPLAYQPFVITENSKQWSMYGINFSNFCRNYMKILNLNFDNTQNSIKSFKKLEKSVLFINILVYVFVIYIMYIVIKFIYLKTK